MSLQEQVKNAGNPQEALQAIARYLDVLDTKINKVLEQPAEQGWGEWEAPTEATPEDPLPEYVMQLREQIKEADGEDRAALEAQLKLLTDKGYGIEPEKLEEGVRPVVEQDEHGNTVVDFPAPDEQQLAMRKRFVEDVLLKDPAREHLAEPFLKGGPLYLYLGDRDFVANEMPPQFRSLFVQDVERNSPQDAREMARDILKVPTEGLDGSDTQLERL